MPNTVEIKLLETYDAIPIVEVEYKEPTLLTAEKEREQARLLLSLPYPTFAVVINYKNLSNASDYGPEEQAQNYRGAPFRELNARVIAFVRYHAASFTSMIQSMRANVLLKSSVQSNFAPDQDSALRIARRIIDQSGTRCFG